MQSMNTTSSSEAVRERIANPSLRLPVAATGGPILQLDLLQEAQKLREEPEWSSGRNARTLVKHADIRVVLTVMKAGTKMHQHHTKGSVSIQSVSGHVRIHVLEGSFDLHPGQILALDPELAHDVEALDEDIAVLVSIAWPHKVEVSSEQEASRVLPLATRAPAPKLLAF